MNDFIRIFLFSQMNVFCLQAKIYINSLYAIISMQEKRSSDETQILTREIMDDFFRCWKIILFDNIINNTLFG